MVTKNGIIVSLVMFILGAGLPAGAHAEDTKRRAIAEAQDAAGERRLWLHPTEIGSPVYKAMGFADGASLELHGFGA